MTNEQPVVLLEHAQKSFGGTPVLKDISLKVQPGEVVAVIGPSGGGKSTLLETLDAGRLVYGDLVVAESDGAGAAAYAPKAVLKEAKTRFGLVFQNFNLFPHYSVLKNITDAPLHVQKRPKDEVLAAARGLLAKMGLSERANHYPSQLSGGQQQRVALARILAYEPEVLLLDEPFSAMDTYLREGLRLELSQGLSTYDGLSILVTHDRDEAYQLCGNLLLMEKGHVLGMGGTREMFQNPRTVEAARLTGCKNISKIERIGERKIRAMDWGGLELVTEKPIDDTMQAVGIRAHDFIPLSEVEAALWQGRPEANLVPTGNVRISEMPFEWYVTLENGLWWKIEKNIHSHSAAGVVPPWLRIERLF